MHFEAMIYCFNSPDANEITSTSKSRGNEHFDPHKICIVIGISSKKIGISSVDGPLICNHSAQNRKADLVARLLEEERLKKKRKRERAPQEVVEDVEDREIPTRKGNPRH